MTNEKKVEWLLRVGVAGEFAGHGVFALQGKADWIKWAQQLSGMDASTATTFIFVVGVVDVLLALLILVKPIRPLFLFISFFFGWGGVLGFLDSTRSPACWPANLGFH